MLVIAAADASKTAELDVQMRTLVSRLASLKRAAIAVSNIILHAHRLVPSSHTESAGRTAVLVVTAAGGAVAVSAFGGGGAGRTRALGLRVIGLYVGASDGVGLFRGDRVLLGDGGGRVDHLRRLGLEGETRVEFEEDLLVLVGLVEVLRAQRSGYLGSVLVIERNGGESFRVLAEESVGL